jgi:hypothetical protein
MIMRVEGVAFIFREKHIVDLKGILLMYLSWLNLIASILIDEGSLVLVVALYLVVRLICLIRYIWFILVELY